MFLWGYKMMKHKSFLIFAIIMLSMSTYFFFHDKKVIRKEPNEPIIARTNYYQKSDRLNSRATGLSGDLVLSNANASFLGMVQDGLGTDVAILGDVNGDGYDDFIISAPHAGINAEGKCYLFFGGKKNWQMRTAASEANITFVGEAAKNNLGKVARVGDLNGDGLDDILLGSSDANKVYIFLGKKSGWSSEVNVSESNAFFQPDNSPTGLSIIAAGGDMNGDDLNDFLVTFPDTIYLLAGKLTGWDSSTSMTPIASFTHETTSGMPRAKAIIPDVNGDGYDDIMIGDHSDDYGGLNAGQIYLFFGKSDGWQMDQSLSTANASFIGEVITDYLRYTGGIGDVDGDGLNDLLLMSPYNDNERGKCYIVFGKTAGWSLRTDVSQIQTTIVGETEEDGLGHSVEGVGDLNVDGYDDFLVSSIMSDNKGRSYLIEGRPRENWSNEMVVSVVATQSYTGENTNRYAGVLASKGDINGDSFTDILIGVSGDSYNGYRAGQAYLVFTKQDNVFDINLMASLVNQSTIGGNVYISVDSSDNDLLRTAMIYLDGNHLINLTSFPAAFILNTSESIDGFHLLSFDAEDRFGLVDNKITFNLSFDNTPPTFEEIGTSPDTPAPGYIISIYTVINDASPISNVKVSYQIDGTAWNTIDMDLYIANTYKGDLGTFLEGTDVSYYINASDRLGNLKTSDTRSFLVSTSVITSTTTPLSQTTSTTTPLSQTTSTTTPTTTTTTPTTTTTTPTTTTTSFEIFLVPFSVILLIIRKRKTKK